MKNLFYTLLFLSAFLPSSLLSQNYNPETISRKLQALLASDPNGMHSVHLVLADQVDMEALDQELTSTRALPGQRNEAVVKALMQKASDSQAPLLGFLKNSPLADANSVRSFWAANAIFAKMKGSLIADLSRRPDVLWIGLNGKLELDEFSVQPAPPPSFSPDGHEEGLGVIDAPLLWAMGYTGYGRLALTNDTGVHPAAPALSKSYKGLLVPAEQAFFDYDSDLQTQRTDVDAFDCHYHGTHVTGTILGLDRMENDTIGVAFNAQWMGAASIVCDGGTEHLLATFQWSMDPDGNPATSADVPDVINNSWYDPGIDTLDCYSVYVPLLVAMETAGLAVVFSAGNEGPGVSTITPPHNVNENLVNSFTVGAVNGNLSYLPIATFSSRGPSICPASDSSLMIKPEVSAPGVQVRSCVPWGYELLDGTSMAAPHVSGAILLLKEAFPYLTGKELKLALYYTCTDLGSIGEDNLYGMGVINVMQAFNYLVDQGHVPVSPQVLHDAFIVELQLPTNACENEVTPVLIIENGGTEPLTSLEVNYSVGSVTNSTTWTGNLPQKARAQVFLPTLDMPTGLYEVEVEVFNPNGVADERPLNNFYKNSVNIIDRQRLSAGIEGSQSACEGASALLRANYDGPGFAAVRWYDQPFGGDVIGIGNALPTPPLAVADTFYAEATYYIPAGLPSKDGAPNEIKDEEGIGLRFDAHQDLNLASVRVYAAESGLRQFQLFDNTGEKIYQTILNVPASGAYQVTLNWDIPAGSNYEIVKSAGKGLYANIADVAYPIAQPGYVTIKGNNTSTTDAYYYFYDWQFDFPEICERTQVIVPVSGVGNTPGASFSASSNEVFLNFNGPVQFTNTSTDDADSFNWNFGDGTTSTEENPTHLFTETGTYVVSLAITNQAGCTAYALDTIVVAAFGPSATDDKNILAETVAVYPNPTNNALNIQFDLSASQMVRLNLSDVNGKMVQSKQQLATQNERMQLDLSALNPGVYFLLVEINGNSTAWKVVKI